MAIKRFDVFWVALDPTKGSEIQKTRPAIVISPDELNDSLNTVIIAPLTSILRGKYSFRPQIEISGKKGEVVLDQIRSVDKSLLQNKMGELSGQSAQEILDVLQEMFEW